MLNRKGYRSFLVLHVLLGAGFCIAVLFHSSNSLDSFSLGWPCTSLTGYLRHINTAPILHAKVSFAAKDLIKISITGRAFPVDYSKHKSEKLCLDHLRHIGHLLAQLNVSEPTRRNLAHYSECYVRYTVARFSPAEFYFINIPMVSNFKWRPFTGIWNENSLAFLVKVAGSYTEGLNSGLSALRATSQSTAVDQCHAICSQDVNDAVTLNLGRAAPTSGSCGELESKDTVHLPVIIEGGYTLHSSIDIMQCVSARQMIAVAGGVGITPLLSRLMSFSEILATGAVSHALQCERIMLVWTCKGLGE